MAHEKFKCKLSAIFSASMAGCSRFMQNDKAATVKTLGIYKNGILKQHHDADGFAV